MFTIYGGNTEFNQWDVNQRVTEPSLVAGDKVIFRNSSGMTHPMKAYTDNGTVVVDVPNELLTMAVPVLVYVNGHPETRTSIPVVAQDKPEGYVLVDNDDWPSDEVCGVDKLLKSGGAGYEEVTPSIDIEWDGNGDGLTACIGDGGYYIWYKLSDIAPTDEQLKQATLRFPAYGGDVVQPITEEIWAGMVEQGLVADDWVMSGFGMVIRKPNTYVELVDTLFTETGSYFLKNEDGAYCSRLSIPSTKTIHPIDPKFIPVMDSLVLNGADGKQYKIAVDASGALTATAI